MASEDNLLTHDQIGGIVVLSMLGFVIAYNAVRIHKNFLKELFNPER